MHKTHRYPVNKVFRCPFSSTLYSSYFLSYLTRFTTVFSNLALRASVQMFISVYKKKKISYRYKLSFVLIFLT